MRASVFAAALFVLVAGAREPAIAADRVPPTRSLVGKLPPRTEKLPATARHGLIGHLRQYPAVGLATPREKARARRVLAQLVSAARRGGWRDVRSAARAGYGTRTAIRRPGDRSVRYFHSERHQEPRGRVLLDASRPKALIYANAPGRRLVLVGAMWSMRDGERGRPGRADHALALACRVRRGRPPRHKAAPGRQMPAWRAPHPGTERDAARLVHA